MFLVDKIILGFIAIGAVVGLFRGFFREIVGTIGVLVAAVAANIVSPELRHWAELVVTGEKAVALVAWIGVFVLVLIAMALLSRLLERFFSALALGWLVRLAGALFGAVKFLLIAAVMVVSAEFCYEHLPFLGGIPLWMQESEIIPMLHQLVHALFYNA